MQRNSSGQHTAGQSRYVPLGRHRAKLGPVWLFFFVLCTFSGVQYYYNRPTGKTCLWNYYVFTVCVVN